jgi:NitT/TauT family transport system substrate-binding protein
VSVQARILQMAVAKQWGDKEFARLDKITQTLPHPDAAAAIIGRHGTQRPLRQFAVPGTGTGAKSERAHRADSYDVQGGPSSSTLLYATEKYRKDNPKTYRAFIAALAEAAQYANSTRRAQPTSISRSTRARWTAICC